MPDIYTRTRLARALAQGLAIAVMGSALLSAGSRAETAPDAVKVDEPITSSAMDAPLFYQLLMGELQLQAGEAGNAFQILLDAARRTNDEVLFRRVVGIALRARAGDQALIAAKAWREHMPASLEAAQTTVQLLVGLNRPGELGSPLAALLELTPADKRDDAINALPHMLQRMPEHKLVLSLMKTALRPYMQRADTAIAAQVALARFTSAAGDTSGALTLLQAASTAAPADASTALAALELMGSSAQAESLVQAHLKAKPDSDFVRLNYGRMLARDQRHGDAVRELSQITRTNPKMLAAWMSLGALQLELRRPAEAEAALKSYLAQADAAAKQGASGREAEDGMRKQAYLLLAQAAELKGDLKAAESWLGMLGDTKEILQVQYRRASVLSRQGKLDEGIKLLQDMAEPNDESARAKLSAQAQLLREARQWQAAYDLLAAANKRFPGDSDLLYEHSMMAEKLSRMDEMEALLRKVIALKPDHHHAYNALGYSLADRNVRLDEAKQLVEKALELAPNEPFLIDSLGWVQFRMGHHEAALRLLTQAYRSRPDTEIAAHLGEVLWMMGRQDDARRIWREGSERDRDNEALRETLARLQVKL
jgi:tetratricopeptide (TPR) repeat protein